MADKQRMILCAGLQSGGTTLASWCFLQRRDTNGVLDMPHDEVQVRFDAVVEPVVWCKMTVGAFRWQDVHALYRDLGWDPEPLLVVRDVRAVFVSLMKKNYGFNGTTAEQPPLRVRFRRFLEDWQLFQARRWPILKFEDLLRDGIATLQKTCDALRLSWDEGMVLWPKRLSDIAYVNAANNRTFKESVAKGTLAAATLGDKTRADLDSLPQSELEWLEAAFSSYNESHGYPLHVPHQAALQQLPPPQFEGTSRHWYLSELTRLRSLQGPQLPRNCVFRRLPQYSRGAEIGVYKGEFSRLILERIKPVEFHLIDPWEYFSDPTYEKSWYGGSAGKDQANMDFIYRSVSETFRSLGNVVIHRSRSADCAHLFPEAYFDWVYVDGNHQYEFVKQDLELYFPKVKPGGFIAGDDYGTPGWWDDGVTRAVDEFVSRHPCEIVMTMNHQFVLQKSRRSGGSATSAS